MHDSDSLLAASALPIPVSVCVAMHYKRTGKTRLASTVQAGVQPVSSLATLEVLIERRPSQLMAITRYMYYYSKLAIDNGQRFFGGAEGSESFSCPPRNLLISLQLLVLSIAIVTVTVYAHA